MKKTIVFILPDLQPGGAERIAVTILNHLDSDQYIPKLILMRKEGFYLDFLNKNIEIFDLKTQRIRHSILPIFRTLKKIKPDIVFCGFGEVNAYLSPFIPFFRKIKFIARETNVVSKHVTRPEIRFFYKFYNIFHKIIAQSDDMKNDLILNFNINPQKIIKINNPVDINFIQDSLVESVFPSEFSTESKNVVAIGNLSSRKGFDNLLKVFSHLKQEKINLYILGEGEEEQSLLELKNQLNIQNVHFLGRKKNPYPYLKFADLFILSSRYEGFPNVLLEAGICGTYSLVNNCPGGINEIIQPQINGEIKNIENFKAFAQTILSVLKQKHDSEAIKNSISARYSTKIIVEKFTQLFDNIK